MIGTGRVWETSAIRAPEGDHHLDPERVGGGRDRLREGAPAQVRLGAVEQDEVAVGGRARGPRSGCSAATRCGGSGPRSRVIVGRVAWKSKNSSGSIWAISSASSESATAASAVEAARGGVVPAAEGADQDRRAQLRHVAFPGQ